MDYKPGAETLLYAKLSRGFRSGGYQPAGATNALAYTPFDKKSALSYEAGSKLMLFERTLRLNVAAYVTRYDNIQQIAPTIPPGSTTTISSVLNAGEARIRGVEIDAQWRIGALNLNAAPA